MRSVSCFLDLQEKVFQAFSFCQICSCPPVKQILEVKRRPGRSRSIYLRVPVAFWRSDKQSCLGTRLQGEALHCGDWWKLLPSALISHLAFSWAAVGGVGGQWVLGTAWPAGLGVCFAGPMGAFQTGQLSGISQLLKFCFILLLDQVICVHSSATLTCLLTLWNTGDKQRGNPSQS